MKIVIVNLSYDLRTIGALNVSTFLRDNGYKNSFIYFFIRPGSKKASKEASDNLISFLRSINPDIIAFSLTTFYFHTVKNLTVHIKNLLPCALIIWGGIHPTVAPEECLNFCDIVCLGEGEEPFLELVQKIEHNIDFCKTKNLWIKRNQVIYKNDIRHLCENLDSRPFPYIDWNNTYVLDNEAIVPLTKELFNKYRPMGGIVYDIMASRGCPFSCTYCCNSKLNKMYRSKGKILRFRSVDHILSELKYVTNNFPEVKIFDFQDDAFGSAPEDYIYRFCKAYKEKIGLPFHIRIMPNMINEKKIKLLKDAGLVGAVMGLQGSDRMNIEIYKRPTTQKLFIDVAHILHKNEIVGRYDVIIDNPYSCEEDEIEAISTFMNIPKPYGLIIYSLAFFPFTELTENAMKNGKYNLASSGYNSFYGYNIKHLFPILAQILEMTPYTPSILINIFLKIRNSLIGKFIICKYYDYVFKLESLLIKRIQKNVRMMLFLKNLWFKVSNCLSSHRIDKHVKKYTRKLSMK